MIGAPDRIRTRGLCLRRAVPPFALGCQSLQQRVEKPVIHDILLADLCLCLHSFCVKLVAMWLPCPAAARAGRGCSRSGQSRSCRSTASSGTRGKDRSLASAFADGRAKTVVYILKYRTLDGRQRWHTIGRHGAPWTPDMARDEARRLLGEVVKGDDPARAKGEAQGRDGRGTLRRLSRSRRGRPNPDATQRPQEGDHARDGQGPHRAPHQTPARLAQGRVRHARDIERFHDASPRARRRRGSRPASMAWRA